jgi:hypothetical protein
VCDTQQVGALPGPGGAAGGLALTDAEIRRAEQASLQLNEYLTGPSRPAAPSRATTCSQAWSPAPPRTGGSPKRTC